MTRTPFFQRITPVGSTSPSAKMRLVSKRPSPSVSSSSLTRPVGAGVERIAGHLDDEQASLFVEVHRDRTLDVGLGRHQLDPVARLQLHRGHRLGRRVRRTVGAPGEEARPRSSRAEQHRSTLRRGIRSEMSYPRDGMIAHVPAIARPRTHLTVLLILSLTHLLNDLIQALIPAIYPIIKDSYALGFVQIGLITLTFQVAGSLLQPVVGWHTDTHPMPYSTVVGMTFTLAGLVGLAFASRYGFILASVASIGIGSSIYHPEATRMARHASGGRQGLAQGLFQVGGYIGGALAPLLAALIIVPHGQREPGVVLGRGPAGDGAHGLDGRHPRRDPQPSSPRRGRRSRSRRRRPSRTRRRPSPIGLTVLTLLMFSKNAYGESFRSFYTFYLIDRFGVSIQTSQLMLFILLIAAAAGALLGGIVGDRIGRHRIIWISVLGPLPFTLLLPYANFFWTGVLTVVINLVMASAFASILIYAMELIPNRIGLIGGLFYGLNFGLGGIAAALLGGLADHHRDRARLPALLVPAAGRAAGLVPAAHRGAPRRALTRAMLDCVRDAGCAVCGSSTF